MIFVTLGTQDKSFERLLKLIDKEIDSKVIKEEVIVQAGDTKYKSKNMKILKYVSMDEFEKYMKKADLIITHGGVGSINTALSYNKKVIACPRLSKYNEHVNDHQKEIVDEFYKLNYLLKLDEEDNLKAIYNKSKKFKPTKYKSNNKEFIKTINNNIDKKHKSLINRHQYLISSFILYLLAFTISFISYHILNIFIPNISYLISSFIGFIFIIYNRKVLDNSILFIGLILYLFDIVIKYNNITFHILITFLLIILSSIIMGIIGEFNEK